MNQPRATATSNYGWDSLGERLEGSHELSLTAALPHGLTRTRRGTPSY